jgi:hypothetical protein
MQSLCRACKANGRNFQTSHFGQARQCNCLVFLLIVNLTTFFLQASSIVSTFFGSYSILVATIVVVSLHASHLFLLLFPFSALFTSLAIATDATSEILYGHVWSEAWDIHPSWEP